MESALSAPAKVTMWNRNFICVVLANLMLCIAHFSVNTLVATYATFLGAAPVVMGVLTGMFFGVSLAIRPISGPMITKIDKRKLMIMVFALGGVVNIGYALFNSIPFFVAFRFLNGVQYSFVGSLIMTLAADSLPREKLASGMGIYGVGGAVGTAFGPTIGYGLLQAGTAMRDEALGYTFVFLFAAVTLSLAVIPSILLHPDVKTKAQVASTGAWYKNIVTVHAIPTTLVMFLSIISYAMINSYIFNLGAELGLGGVGLFYTFMACTLIVTRPLSGWLSDRFGAARVIIPGTVLMCVALVVIGSSQTLNELLVGAVIAALGVGATHPTVQAMNMLTETPLRRSVASNTIYVGMDLGLFAGPLLGSLVYKYSGSYAFMFRVAFVPVLLSLVCFIIILPVYKKRVRHIRQLEQGPASAAEETPEA